MNASAWAAFAASTTSSSVAPGLPRLMLSAMLSRNRWESWNTRLRLPINSSWLISRTSTPPTRTWPESTSQKRATRFASVDLPEPLGPTTAHTVPAGISSETSRNAGSASSS